MMVDTCAAASPSTPVIVSSRLVSKEESTMLIKSNKVKDAGLDVISEWEGSNIKKLRQQTVSFIGSTQVKGRVCESRKIREKEKKHKHKLSMAA